MLNATFKKNVQEELQGSHIVNENTKISVDMLADTDVTIEDFDALTSDGDTFYAVTTVENPGQYFFSGKALTDLINACVEAGEDIRGERIHIGVKTRTKSGRTFTPVTLL